MAEPSLELGRRGDRSSLRDALDWARSCLELQLGRQSLVALGLDLFLVGFGVLAAMTSPGAPGPVLYTSTGLVPLLALGVPALADLVALERRAGCLDLALAAPAGELYFLRRAGVVLTVLLLQAGIVVLGGWIATDGSFPLLTVVGQLVAVTLFTGAATVFWATRLGNAGSVWLASMATVAIAAHWTFWMPVVSPRPGGPRIGKLLPDPWGTWEWATRALPLLVGATLLLLYARRRLRRPELLLRAT
jgi:hypothetical protein